MNKPTSEIHLTVGFSDVWLDEKKVNNPSQILIKLYLLSQLMLVSCYPYAILKSLSLLDFMDLTGAVSAMVAIFAFILIKDSKSKV